MSKQKIVRAKAKHAVFIRDGIQCIMCTSPPEDAHHIIPRKLFPAEFQYVLENLVSLCAKCHILAEEGKITPERLRGLAGITKVVTPENVQKIRKDIQNITS